MAHRLLSSKPSGCLLRAGHGVLKRRHPAHTAHLAFLTACCITVSAILLAARAGAQGIQPPESPTNDNFPAPKPADRPTIVKEATLQGLKPQITGLGIVVCEPAASKAPGDLAAFGAGCGRWLHFTVGGRGEFPQTPLWRDLPRAQHEMGRTDFRLDASHAGRLRRITGTTHAAFGTISGTAWQCRLTYRVWDVVRMKPVGRPIGLVGTMATVGAKLPRLAQALAASLGARKHGPSVPAPAAAELLALGRVPWDPGQSLTPSQDRDLNRLATRLPTAGLILFDRYDRRQRSILTDPVGRLMRQAPENALVVAEVGCFDPMDFGETGAKAAARLQNRFQDHATMMAAVGSWCIRTLDAPVDAIRAAKEAVRAAPANPSMWMALSDVIGGIAESVRKGRYWSELNPEEAEFCRRLYPVELAAAQRAVALDPLYAEGWNRVSIAATMDGDAELAHRALRTSIRLDGTNSRALYWGLEIYQPKWFADKAMLDRAAQRAVAVAKASSEPQWYYSLAFHVRDVGYPHEYEVMVRRAIVGFQQVLKADPSNVYAQLSLSNALYWLDDLGGAIRVAEAGTKHSPKVPEIWANIGSLYREDDRWDRAVEAFTQAVKLEPQDSVSRRDLAYALLWRKLPVEAEAVVREGIRLQPEYWRNYNTLGGVFIEAKRPDDAIPAFQRAIELNDKYFHTVDGESEGGLAGAYVQKGMANEAIEHAKKAIGNHPVEGIPHMILGDAYAAANRDEEAVAEYTTGIKLHDYSPNTRLKRGKLFLKLGRKAEARADWREAVKSAPGTDAAKEAQELLAGNP